MTEVSVSFEVGSESVTTVLPVDLPTGGETIITGDFGGVVAAGTTARLRGSVNLTGNLHVRGTLLCDPSGVDLNGNGFDIHTHDGILDLVGTEKTAWCNWGDPVVGWQVGDRLAVAPTAVGKYDPTETTWQGSWAATTRPTVSPAVTLFTGQVMQPEVANLSQTVVLRNLQRIHLHEATQPTVHTLKWIKVLNSGQTAILGMYPVHFHLNGEHTRGSLVEGVVVEGGKHHAFVPHGSHGITLRDCVAFNTVEDAFWWDLPEEYIQTPGVPCPNCDPATPSGEICPRCGSYRSVNGREHHTANNSNDTTWDHCLVLGLNSTEPFNPMPLGGFLLGAGKGNKCLNSVATAIRRGTDPSGFHWSSRTNRNDGGTTWEFRGNVAHNIGYKTIVVGNGIFVWQNAPVDVHDIDDFKGYHFGKRGVDHGSYQNRYQYRDVVIHGAKSAALAIHPVSVQGASILFQDFITNGPLWLEGHQIASDGTPTILRRCKFTTVKVDEAQPGSPTHSSLYLFEDCDLAPADFTMVTVNSGSVFELWEAGVLQHRWAGGVWS